MGGSAALGRWAIVGVLLGPVAATVPSCSLPNTTMATLFSLDAHDPHFLAVASTSASDCCQICAEKSTCNTWSYTAAKWTPATPCHLSAFSPIAIEPVPGSPYAGGCRSGHCVVVPAPPTPPPPPPPTPPAGPIAPGVFQVQLNATRQIILGIGYEIQSDSIGSGNHGMPDGKISGVPHDLVPSERTRFYNEMLKGFRFCRLALGLYFRGLDQERQHMIERWPTQLAELYEMQQGAGIDGFEAEYWSVVLSPAPFWKGPNQSWYCASGGAHVRSAAPEFVEQFADAMLQDALYLNASKLRLKWWGLQNEPYACTGYGSMQYNSSVYHEVFAAVAPKMIAAFPNLKLHVSSGSGCLDIGAGVYNDPVTRGYVDGWTFHHTGSPSNSEMKDERKNCPLPARGGQPAPAFNNEYEYLGGAASPDRCINTAQDVMNWFVFSEAPKWTWLHALKPTYNSEASGYGLGFWRPYDDNSTTTGIEKGYWKYNYYNWNSLAGFAKWMPWNAVRVTVQEDTVRQDQRVLAYLTPSMGAGGPQHTGTAAGRLGVVLTNRNPKEPFNVTLRLTNASSGSIPTLPFRGYRYGPNVTGIELGQQSVSSSGEFTVVLPPQSIEFWLCY